MEIFSRIDGNRLRAKNDGFTKTSQSKERKGICDVIKTPGLASLEARHSATTTLHYPCTGSRYRVEFQVDSFASGEKWAIYHFERAYLRKRFNKRLLNDMCLAAQLRVVHKCYHPEWHNSAGSLHSPDCTKSISRIYCR
jgi:hypothetical protein